MPQHQEYIDDFALFLSAPNTELLWTSLVPSCEAVLRTYHLLGLPVNVSPGKTSLLLSLTGAGSARRRTDMEVDGALALQLGNVSLPVVRRYKYL
eukprot:5334777-Prorocentrum_lima.AAC.1